MASLADTLEPPYYAAILENQTHETADEPMNDTDRLVTLAVRRPGFLGLETARDSDGKSLTVAYWRELSDVEGWTSEGAADKETFPLQVKRVANANDRSVGNLYQAPEHSRSALRHN